MGYGLLFIGFLVAFLLRLGMGIYGFAATVLGYFIMFAGLSELRKYFGGFVFAKWLCVPLFLCGIFGAVNGFNEIFLIGIDMGISNDIAEIVRYVLECAFLILLLRAVLGIAKELELPRHVSRARAAIVFTAILYVYQLIITTLSLTGFDGDINFLSQLLVVLDVAYILFTAALIFYCYMFMCPEGEEKMERKPSRFAFVNKLRAKKDARDKKASDEAAEYLRKRREQKANRRKRK